MDPLTVAEVVERFGLPTEFVLQPLGLLADSGTSLKGEFRANFTGTEWCHPDKMRAIRWASAAAYALQAQPIHPSIYPKFSAVWQRVTKSTTTPASAGGLACWRLSKNTIVC
jgi:ATP-dependent Lhr-like helicase